MISVCMATYNGEKYIREQLNSILSQIGPYDEIVITDDGSSDQTLQIVQSFRDSRISFFSNSCRLGHVKNFERALSLSKGELIFLSDQDDIWAKNRLQKMIDNMRQRKNVLLVASNFDLINEYGSPIGNFRKLGPVRASRWLQVFDIFVGRAPYYGCTFLIDRRLLKYCMPFPAWVESHDIWMALVSSLRGGVVNMHESTLLHRVHDKNVTVKERRFLWRILKSRIEFSLALLLRARQILRSE